MVLRVKPTPTRFPTNSLYTLMDNTLLHSIPSVCHPWGQGVLYAGFISFERVCQIAFFMFGASSDPTMRPLKPFTFQHCIIIFLFEVSIIRKGMLNVSQ